MANPQTSTPADKSSATDDPNCFTLRTMAAGPALVVTVRGELDVTSLASCRPTIQTIQEMAHRGAPRRIILDLSACTYLDSMALGFLVRVMEVAEQAGGRAVFVCPVPHLRRLLEVTRLTRILMVVDSREEAQRIVESVEHEEPSEAMSLTVSSDGGG